MATGAERIKELCDSWRAAASGSDGSIQISHSTEQFRLLANGIAFHELDHAEVRAACLGLSTVLLMPGLNTIIDADHLWFWSWCGEVLCAPSRGDQSVGPLPYFAEGEEELRDLLGLCIRAALATLYPPSHQYGALPSVEANAREWVQGGHSALAYLAFPLLEGVVKRHLRRFVDMQGVVLQEFSVPGVGGRGPKSYVVDRTCSSLRDLLYLLYNEVASEELRHDLDEQRSHLSAFADEAVDGFDTIYGWRNSSLHGGASLPTVGGTILNTALLVAMSDLEDGYEGARAKVLERVRFELQGNVAGGSISYRSPWSYYPPYN